MDDVTPVQDQLRAFAESFPGEMGRKIMKAAADRIDELQTHIKLINRIGGLGTEKDIDVRLKIAEEEIRQMKRMLGGFATRLDLEMVQMELQNRSL